VDPPAFRDADRTAGPPPLKWYSTEAQHQPPPLPFATLRRTFFDRRITFVHLLCALLLTLASAASVALTYKGFGYSWDEALYHRPAQEAVNWWRAVFSDPRLLSDENITRAWGQRLTSDDPLHPEIGPLPKVVLGSGSTFLSERVHDPLLAMRLPVAALFGLTVALAYLFAALEFGQVAGFAAALFYWLTPRVFGHAHIGASETLLAFCTALTWFLFALSTRRPLLSPLVGLAFGLAIATKVTSLVFPAALLIWAQVYRRRDYSSAAFFMLFLGPITALALWPWLWHDGLRRFFGYLLFYAEHQSTAVYYLGRIWGYTHGPPAPWHYPWVITGVGTPEWLLILALLGCLRAAAQVAVRPVAVLFLLGALLWICLSSMQGAPKYDGERLFFPSFFFIALLAAGGFAWIFDGIALARFRARAREIRHWVTPWFALFAITAYAAADLFLTHPNELNYFNYAIGRPAGALRHGFETSYWGEALNEDCLAWMRQSLKPADRVQVLAMNELCFEDLRQWDRLPRNVDFTANQPPINFIVLQVRQGFLGRYERELRASQKPIKVFAAQGVPRIEVYEGPNPRGTQPSTADTSTSPSTNWRISVPSGPDKPIGTGRTEKEISRATLTADAQTSSVLVTTGTATLTSGSAVLTSATTTSTSASAVLTTGTSNQ
jgi:hypothetical protein